MINRQIIRVLPAVLTLFCVTAFAHGSLRFFSFCFLCFCVSLFLNSYSLTPPLSVPPLSLQHVPPFLFLCPPSSPPFSPLPSWQHCQSGQAERGKHSTGQSRGRSKGWRIDYVYVCVLKCPLSVGWCVCLRFGHTQLQVMQVRCECVMELLPFCCEQCV